MTNSVPPLTVMSRVVLAVLLREMQTRFGKNRLGYLWALFEPVLHVSVYLTVFILLGRSTPLGDSLPLFLITGVTPWLLFSHVLDRTMRAVDGNRALLTYPHVMPLDLIIARSVLEAATKIVVFVILCAGCYVGFGPFAVERPLDVLAALASLALIGAGVGMIAAAIAAAFPTFDRLFPAIKRPLYFTSGVFFLAERLPPQARDWLALNPLLHAIEWLRSAFFPDFESTVANPLYPVAFGCCALFLGLIAERLTRLRIRLA